LLLRQAPIIRPQRAPLCPETIDMLLPFEPLSEATVWIAAFVSIEGSG
jgi:hypothetical protein